MSRLRLKPAQIQIREDVLPRGATNRETVDRYTELIRLGVEMPPLDVFQVGDDYVLADGRYRLEAHVACGKSEVLCEVRRGTLAEAVWFAMGANREHGLPLTNAERREAIKKLLMIEELRSKADGTIATQVGCSTATVNRIRAQMVRANVIPNREEVEKRTRDGKTIKLKLEDVAKGKGGRKKKTAKKSEANDAPLPDIEAPDPDEPEEGEEITREVAQQRLTRAQQRARERATVQDAVGQAIPDFIADVFADKLTIAGRLTQLSEWFVDTERAIAAQSGAGREIDTDAIVERMNEIRKLVNDGLPHAVCPKCLERGTITDDCKCGGKGWLTQAQHQKLARRS